MKRPRLLEAFSKDELEKAYLLLASRVAIMQGRKFEEGDWAAVYCGAKGIKDKGWSNLSIDVIHENLGVEHKMLCVRSDRTIQDLCGTTLMHPSATRSIRIPDIKDPTKAARNVLKQYAELIGERTKKVAQSSQGNKTDLRTGWLLWQDSLHEFLYWEEEMLPPVPEKYRAEWKTSGGGTRKPSKNLWVYENETGKKRFSITTQAGPKIQPYFDVPTPGEKGLYRFVVQGEILPNGNIRIWITKPTALFLKKLIGEITSDSLTAALKKIAAIERQEEKEGLTVIEHATPIELSAEAYALLSDCFKGVSDEHKIQQLVQMLL